MSIDLVESNATTTDVVQKWDITAWSTFRILQDRSRSRERPKCSLGLSLHQPQLTWASVFGRSIACSPHQYLTLKQLSHCAWRCIQFWDIEPGQVYRNNDWFLVSLVQLVRTESNMLPGYLKEIRPCSTDHQKHLGVVFCHWWSPWVTTYLRS